ncbi:MAG: aminoacyl-tRNA hydrolase [Candidatus Omnitrophota bacterium]
MERRLKIIYKKNLKMSTGKVAAQCVHAAAGLGFTDGLMSVVVLGVSDNKWKETMRELGEKGYVIPFSCYVVKDAGYTEVKPGTETCAAYFENV